MRDIRLVHDPPKVSNHSTTLLDKRETEEELLNMIILEKCRYCGCDDRFLKQCLFCGSVAYCSDEHQQFDWKRHKPLCKQAQAELQRRQTLQLPASPSFTAHKQTETASLFMSSREPSPVDNETSISLVAGIALSSSQPSPSASLLEERLVFTDDSDIQPVAVPTLLRLATSVPNIPNRALPKAAKAYLRM